MKIPSDMVAGATHETNNSGRVEIIEYKSWDKVKIKFEDTGTITTTRSERVRNGKIKDLNKPSVYGVGFVGYGPYSGGTGRSGAHNQAYKIWHNMFKRCYSGAYPTYADCSVHPCWHSFQVFAKWYGENHPNDGERYDLDKDIKVQGNRVYGPDLCVFVNQAENKSKARAIISRLKNPSGVEVEIYNLRAFCIDEGLSYTSLNEVKLGRKQSYKGWTKAD